MVPLFGSILVLLFGSSDLIRYWFFCLVAPISIGFSLAAAYLLVGYDVSWFGLIAYVLVLYYLSIIEYIFLFGKLSIVHGNAL